MLKPENTHPGDQDVARIPTDDLETTQSSAPGLPLDSASSQADAGLLELPDPLAPAFQLEDEGSDPNEDSIFAPEITMTDLAAHMTNANHTELEVPDMDDLNTPGHMDIEGLDDDALSDTDIPRDALLDPLEP